MVSKLDYLNILKALNEIPFGVGRNLLINFLQGKKNPSIDKNRLHTKASYGSLAYEKEELNALIDNLLLNNLIRMAAMNENRFWKLLELTPKGEVEIRNPTLHKRKLAFNFKENKTKITKEDKKSFKAFGELLTKFNDAQKKAIICPNKHILCIAGAGSGKTTVLTKRIEFLVKYSSVDPSKILAITFTRKARQEMLKRLSIHPLLSIVRVETFNSFCEKILRKHNNLLYDKPIHVINYGDKLRIISRALSKLKMSMDAANYIYFTAAQRRGKTDEQLANIFMNDCFFLRDYFKFKNKELTKSSFETTNGDHERCVNMIVSICKFIDEYMQEHGLRDFADQLLDAIALFEQHKELIPEFEHVLIDEYQDVNSTQIKLIDLFNPANLFCVGDPRQSIYGWRGSNIRYILKFEDKYADCEIITLTKNYRSTKHIVELINKSIRCMGLADLDSSIAGKKDIRLLDFKSEATEYEFVAQTILASNLPRNELFVLARTNRQLNELSLILSQRGIKHIMRSDEMRKSVVAGEGDVTLATIHAIKGLEADTVFVVGCHGVNFPCKGSEHPVIEMVKVQEYDKEEEERRLFYVAMSRAKNRLYLSYSGKKPTNFITEGMLKVINHEAVAPQEKLKTKIISSSDSADLLESLKSWRRTRSIEQGIPAYIVLQNKTLQELAQKTPTNLGELEDIYGFGKVKLKKYGKEVLELVNGHS